MIGIAKNQKGDAVMITAVIMGVLGLLLAGSVFMTTQLSNRAQQSALKQEASFYNGEVAALSTYLNSQLGGTLTQGQHPFVIPNDIQQGSH